MIRTPGAEAVAGVVEFAAKGSAVGGATKVLPPSGAGAGAGAGTGVGTGAGGDAVTPTPATAATATSKKQAKQLAKQQAALEQAQTSVPFAGGVSTWSVGAGGLGSGVPSSSSSSSSSPPPPVSAPNGVHHDNTNNINGGGGKGQGRGKDITDKSVSGSNNGGAGPTAVSSRSSLSSLSQFPPQYQQLQQQQQQQLQFLQYQQHLQQLQPQPGQYSNYSSSSLGSPPSSIPVSSTTTTTTSSPLPSLSPSWPLVVPSSVAAAAASASSLPSSSSVNGIYGMAELHQALYTPAAQQQQHPHLHQQQHYQPSPRQQTQVPHGQEIVDLHVRRGVLQDVEASYRELSVHLATLVKVYGQLLPVNVRVHCEELHLTSNPLARDKEIAGNVIYQVLLLTEVSLPQKHKTLKEAKENKFIRLVINIRLLSLCLI